MKKQIFIYILLILMLTACIGNQALTEFTETEPTMISTITALPEPTAIPTSAGSVIQSDEAQNQFELVSTLEGHTGPIWQIAFSPDGQLLASASSDETLRIWEVNSGEALKVIETGYPIYGVAFSGDNQSVGAWGDGTIRLWDVETGEHLRTFGDGQVEMIDRFAFSPTENILATGGNDNTLTLWDIDTGEKIFISENQDYPLIAVEFSPDGSLVSASPAADTKDFPILIWDVKSGENILSLDGHDGYCYNVDFSTNSFPDTLVMASAGADNNVTLWNIASGEAIQTLTGHHGKVMDAAFSPDGNLLVSGSAHDHTVRVWNVESGQTLQVLRHADEVQTVAFSPVDNLFASAGYENKIYLWK
jgi:WD40 repeat protein